MDLPGRVPSFPCRDWADCITVTISRPENPVLQSMHFIARQRENCARRSLSAIRQSLPVRQDVVIAHKDQRHPCPPSVRTCSRKAVSWPDRILARDSSSDERNSPSCFPPELAQLLLGVRRSSQIIFTSRGLWCGTLARLGRSRLRLQLGGRSALLHADGCA